MQDTLGSVMGRWCDEGALPPISIMLAIPLALSIVRGARGLLHSVAMTRKINRSRLLVPGEPSAKRCRNARPRRGLAAVPRARQRLGKEISVIAVVDWVRATRDIKSLKKVMRTTCAFSKLFSKVVDMKASDLMEGVGVTGRELLRRGRVRVDAVAFLVCRENPYFHILCDASPQHRGLEMFAASCDCVCVCAQE